MTKKPKCCDVDLSDVAAPLRAISEPTRLMILCLLRNGKKCVCEIQGLTGLKHNLICHHLKALGNLGILKSTHKNKFTYYELDTRVYNKLLKGMNILLGGK